jgi:hypothetical protein
MIGENQLRGEIESDVLPADAMAHLRERHTGAVDLRSLPVDAELIVWIDLDALPRGISGLTDFRSVHPDVREWAVAAGLLTGRDRSSLAILVWPDAARCDGDLSAAAGCFGRVGGG